MSDSTGPLDFEVEVAGNTIRIISVNDLGHYGALSMPLPDAQRLQAALNLALPDTAGVPR